MALSSSWLIKEAGLNYVAMVIFFIQDTLYKKHSNYK